MVSRNLHFFPLGDTCFHPTHGAAAVSQLQRSGPLTTSHRKNSQRSGDLACRGPRDALTHSLISLFRRPYGDWFWASIRDIPRMFALLSSLRSFPVVFAFFAISGRIRFHCFPSVRQFMTSCSPRFSLSPISLSRWVQAVRYRVSYVLLPRTPFKI